jgi:hypothetical protein
VATVARELHETLEWLAEKKNTLVNPYKHDIALEERRFEGGNLCFQSKWEENFTFTDKDEKNSASHLEYIASSLYSWQLKTSLQKIYHTHFSFEFQFKSELYRNKLIALKSGLRSQQTLLSSFSKETDTMTEASFVISWNIAGAKRPYTDGKFVKENIDEVISILDSNNSNLQRLNTDSNFASHYA